MNDHDFEHGARYGDEICDLTGHCSCFDNGDICCYCGRASDDPNDDDENDDWGV